MVHSPALISASTSKILSGETALQKTHVPPGFHKVKVQLAATSYQFRTFYEVKVVNVENDVQ